MSDIRPLIDGAKRITVLTGAGVSTDSGIPDFKTADESWPYKEERHELISAPYFRRNPLAFWKVYREVFGSKLTARPNRFHYFLASLQAEHEVTIVTQNVDGLHQAAGSRTVIEAHGTMHEAICVRYSCLAVYPMESLADQELPRCTRCGKVLKPNVSLFFEGINGMAEAREALAASDLFIVAGTSLEVGPVNELPYFAELRTKQPMLWLNREAAPAHYNFTHSYRGELGKFLAALS